MNKELVRLVERIRLEVAELEGVLLKIEEGWKRFKSYGDSYYLDSVALNLHGFYSGLERIFELIAVNIDGNRPGGQNWHQELLMQMNVEMPELRPAVISDSSYEMLNDYRGFRHVVRNTYTYKFDPMKLQGLVEKCTGLFLQVNEELLAFANFLEEVRSHGID